MTDDATLLTDLKESFMRQLGWYRELLVLDQKALSTLVLSRGGVPHIMGTLEKKRALLDTIVHERNSIGSLVTLWQDRKASVEVSPRVRELNDLLAQTEMVIRDFLNCEDQLKRYLSHLTGNRAEAAL